MTTNLFIKGPLVKIVGLFLLTLFTFQSMAAENFYGIVYNKYDNKRKVSWNLSDWLSQKSGSAAQDNWLALNTSANFFEFYFLAAQDTYELREDSALALSEDSGVELYRIGLFASIFGVEGEFFRQDSDLKYSESRLTMRLFGKAIQGTNILLYVGNRNREEIRLGYTFDTLFYGASVDLYIFPFFGLFGKYSTILKSTVTDSIDVDGNFSAYGAFIDISILRVVYEVYSESLAWSPASSISTADRDGQRIALQLFF